MKKKLLQPAQQAPATTNAIQLDKISNFDIAVIGMSGRLPLAEDLEEYWANICDGRDCIGEFPAGRIADIENYLRATGGVLNNGLMNFKQKGYLREIDKFDHKFFNIPYKEACLMSPAQRLFLETAWLAVEDALIPPHSIRGSKTGIYLGYTGKMDGYYELVCEIEPELAGMAYPGNLPSIIAGRVAYYLDLKGPSLMIDTACSSSLVAVHMACQSLRQGECSMAIAGGINLSFTPFKANQEGMGVMSSLGKIRSFDDSADGIVGGEGCVAILLKPLAKAIADKDIISAVIKGSATNQDGSSVGITAPNAQAQQDVILQALEQGQVAADTISYIEAHGTGTKLGDPIEIEGITKAFRKHTTKKQFCGLGSVKANIGHLDSVAGIAGLVKCILALQHKKLPPHINFDKPNLKIRFDESPVYINERLTNWEPLPGIPRRCAVSSFGLSGTNCHVVLEEMPEKQHRCSYEGPLLLTLSAKSEWSLGRKISCFATRAASSDAEELADLCYSANTCKEHFRFRVALLASSAPEMKEKLHLLATYGVHNNTVKHIFFSGSDTSPQSIDNELHRETDLLQCCSRYVQGGDVDWQQIYKEQIRNKIRLPLYPFEKRKCWVEYPEQQHSDIHSPHKNPADMTIPPAQKANDSSVLDRLKDIIAKAFDIKTDEVNITATFLEMGLNSISIVQVRQLARNHFNVDVPAYKLFTEVTSIKALATHIEQVNPPFIQPVKQSSTHVPSARLQQVAIGQEFSGELSTNLQKIIEMQLQLMNRQLDLLNNADRQEEHINPTISVAATEQPVAPTGRHSVTSVTEASCASGAVANTRNSFLQQLPDAAKKYLAGFIKDFNERTAGSKREIQDSRKYFANNRNTANYNPGLKDLMYPILAEEAMGAKIFDIDGNEYIDLSMGFGVYLLGYNHPVVNKAIAAQLEKGFFLGPMSALPQQVAKLITELTGVDRVAFYNSGTEAVMVALRLARAASGKNKVAIFAGSYHGAFDGVLVQKDVFSKDYKAAPKSTGIPQKFIDDVILLDYGMDESLEVINKYADELSAVLVEPVQSRRPEFQPREFLHKLRKITEDQGIPLIFDEMITGFRICPGGAQEWFGVKADLVTYGKVAGGGMPIGIVAGKARFMHGVDGGSDWSFGDDSHPKFDHRKTFVAGTFCHHPLAMASAKAILQYLKDEGPALQQRVNALAERLAAELNEFFEEENLNIRIVHFGSLIQVRSEIDLTLLFCLLLKNGIYIWEGLTLYVSAAHTGEDIDYIIRQFKKGIHELTTTGLLKKDLLESVPPQHIPLTDEQKRIWLNASLNPSSAAQFNSKRIIALQDVNIDKLNQALCLLTERHSILRTASVKEDVLILMPDLKIKLSQADYSQRPEIELEQFIKSTVSLPFDLEKGPFIRAVLAKKGLYEYLLVVVAHQIIADGWSFNLFFRELEQLYNGGLHALPVNLPAPVQFSKYVNWLNNYFVSPDGKVTEDFWREKFQKEITPVNLLLDPFEISQYNRAGSYVSYIKENECWQLRELGKQHGASLFMSLLAVFQAFIYRVSKNERLLTGIPIAGQTQMDEGPMLGQCIQLIPFVLEVKEGMTFSSLLDHVKSEWLNVLKFRNFSLNRILTIPDKEETPGRISEIFVPDIKIGFNLDSPVYLPGEQKSESGPASELMKKDQEGSAYDLLLSVIEEGAALRLLFTYRHSFVTDDIMEALIRIFHKIVTEILETPGIVIKNLLHLSDTFADGSSTRKHASTVLGWTFEKQQITVLLHKQREYNCQLPLRIDEGTNVRVAEIIGSVTRIIRERAGDKALTRIPWELLLPGTDRIVVLCDGLSGAVTATIALAAWQQGRIVQVESIEDCGQDVLNGVDCYVSKEAWLTLLKDGSSLLGNPGRLIIMGTSPVMNNHWTLFQGMAAEHVPSWFVLLSNHQIIICGKIRENGSPGFASLEISSEGAAEIHITDRSGDIALPAIRGRLTIEGFAQLNDDELYYMASWHGVRELKVLPYMTRGRAELPHPVIAADIMMMQSGVRSVTLVGSGANAYFSVAYDGSSASVWRNKLLAVLQEQLSPSILPVLFSDEHATQAAGKVEKRLIELYGQVLGTAGIDVNSHFFRTGGNSLRAIQLIGLVNKEFGIVLNLRTLFTSPDIKSFATVIRNAGKGQTIEIPLAEPLSAYPLSLSQQRLWILEQLHPHQSAYNMPRAYLLEGKLDVEALQEAVATLVSRHESLRTTFEEREGRPVQVIHAQAPERGVITMSDLRLTPDKEQATLEIVEKSADTPFNLVSGPLLIVKLIWLEEEKYVLLLNIHHIISDGWSMQVLVKETLNLYDAFINKQENPLTPLRLQYKDFACWQLQRLEDASMEEQREYWVSRFRTQSPVINLPSPYPRPETRSFRGEKKTFQVRVDLAAKMKEECAARGISLIMGLQASVKALIYTYTGLTDQTIGMTIAGRELPELYDQIGFYVNTIPLRTIFSEDNSFGDLVNTLKEASLEAFQYQAYSFHHLVEELRLAHDKGRSPLFDIMVELSTIDIAGNTAPGLDNVIVNEFSFPFHSSKFDLSIRFHDGEDGLFMTFEYRTDLYDNMDGMFRHYEVLVESVLKAWDRPLRQLSVLTAGEEAALMTLAGGEERKWASEEPVMLFEEQVSRQPDAIAVTHGENIIRYGQLNEQINRLAHHLSLNYNVGPEDVIAVLAGRSVETIIAIMAIMKTGAAFLTIDPDYSSNRKKYIIGDAGVRLLLTDSRYLFEINEFYEGPIFALDIQLQCLEESAENSVLKGTPDNLAYLLYTSGSTGKPKGVQISRYSMANYLQWANEYYFNNGTGWTFPVFTSLSFDLTLTSIFSTLLRGDNMIIYDEGSTMVLQQIFRKHSGNTVVKLTPSHITVLDKIRLKETDIKMAIVGGEKLTPEHINILRKINPDMVIYNEYGPTEATVGCMIKKVPDGNDISIGKPIYNTQIYVLGANMQAAPMYCIGEIVIGGKGVARGYQNREDLTREKFVKTSFHKGGRECLYRTGDLARWRLDGDLEFLGRKDDQIKLNGYRIEPGEIEKVMLAYPSISDVTVFAAETGEGTVELSAYYSGAEASSQAIKEYLQTYLPLYMIPSRIIYVEVIPLTSNGKKDRKALELLKVRREGHTGYVAPVNDLHRKIVDIWERVLGREGIGITDSFFSIGGNSLDATQIIARIFQEIGVNVGLNVFFSNPTVMSLYEEIEQAETLEYQEIAPSPLSPDYPLSPSQERLWFLHLLESGVRPAFNIHAFYLLKGRIDIGILDATFHALIARHESLRTVFFMTEDGVRQKILQEEDLDASLKLVDLRNDPDKNRKKQELIEEERTAFFDLEQGPLFKLKLLLMGDEESILMITIHHIIGDGWTFEVLMREMSQLYHAFSKGEESPLPALPIQYKDYAVWARSLLHDGTLDQQRNYWKKKLAGAPAVTSFPFDFPLQNRTNSGKTVKFRIGREETTRLKEIGVFNQASLFMILCSVVNILLYRYTWRTDIIIGTPIAGRVRKELENQVGYFLNTLALRTEFNSLDSFEELVKKTRQSILEAYQHQLIPFDTVVSDALKASANGMSPFFEVGITWQNIRESPANDSLNLEAIALELPGVAARHNLWFFGSEEEDGIDIRIRYDVGLYLESTVLQIRDDFMALCRLLARQDTGPDRINDYVQALIPEEKRVGQMISIDSLNADIKEDF